MCVGSLNGKSIAFLPRHGINHNISPSKINYRANIECLKKLGVQNIISLSAVGSLREDFKPGDFVVVDQFIDNTYLRKKLSLMMTAFLTFQCLLQFVKT